MSSDHQEPFSLSAARALDERVWALLKSNDIRSAIRSCEQLNRQFPDFASGWHTASRLALQVHRPQLGLDAIDRALALQPERTLWLIQKGLCLAQLGQPDVLSDLINQLQCRETGTVYQQSALGMLLTQLGRREEALDCYRQAAALQPGESKHYYNMACLQRSLGEIEDAERNFDEALRLNPADYEACKIRSELRRQTAERNHVDSLRAMLDQGIDDVRGKVQVCYALAKELEDLGEWERSFYYLKMGSDARRSYMRYDVERDLGTMAAIRRTFDADRFGLASTGTDSREPIFVLGLPRTGTTLVERILGSHSQVYAAGELTNFATQMMHLVCAKAGHSKPQRDELVALSATLDFRRLGDSYVDSTRPFTGQTPHFVDKLPLNYLYIGLIHLALPEAKIINLHRHPLDTCYAIYKQLFVDAYPFSYDLDELGRYYIAYHRLMEHWNHVLPGVIHTINYESMVDDLEAESRRLLDYCGLDWESGCLRYYENRNAPTTASATQVRQPVYRSSVGKWRCYREQLGSLAVMLESAGISLAE